MSRVNFDLPKVSKLTFNFKLLKVSKITNLKIYILQVMEKLEASNLDIAGKPHSYGLPLGTLPETLVTSLPHNHTTPHFS